MGKSCRDLCAACGTVGVGHGSHLRSNSGYVGSHSALTDSMPSIRSQEVRTAKLASKVLSRDHIGKAPSDIEAAALITRPQPRIASMPLAQCHSYISSSLLPNPPNGTVISMMCGNVRSIFSICFGSVGSLYRGMACRKKVGAAIRDNGSPGLDAPGRDGLNPSNSGPRFAFPT